MNMRMILVYTVTLLLAIIPIAQYNRRSDRSANRSANRKREPSPDIFIDLSSRLQYNTT